MPANFVTIYTFNYPHQAMVITGRLDAEGIPYRLIDALTIQSDPLLSNAIGGVKLTVQEDYLDAAKEILLDSGLPKQEYEVPFSGFKKWSDNIPGLKSIKTTEFRLLAVSGAVVCALLVVLYFFLEA